MKRTKIVATIGPASDDKEVLREFLSHGVNVCRLNFSHGTHESHLKTIHRIKEVREEMGLPIAIMLDTKGPEIRVGQIGGEGKVSLDPGDEYVFLSEEVLGDEKQATISYEDLWKDIEPGQILLVDDGLLEMEVIEINPGKVRAKALNTGLISTNKGVNVPGAAIRLPSLTKKDEEDIRLAIREDLDFIAASFIRRAEDILAIRAILEEEKCESLKIIAKIENAEGVEYLDEIIRVADGIMVARGDLGVEIEPESLPLIQKEMINKSNEEGIPVITATQMLDSMMRNPRPTRAETSDVANAIFDGTSAIMLSGETASGKYPVEAVKTMAKIAIKTEAALDYDNILASYVKGMDPTITNVIARNACEISRELRMRAIVVATTTGYSARAISKFRPEAKIVAVTPDKHAQRHLALSWGVIPLLTRDEVDVLTDTIPVAQEHGVIVDGDLVVFVAGIPQGITGSTNLLKVHQVAEVRVKGVGVGKDVTRGITYVIRDGEEYPRDFDTGDILVVKNYQPEMARLVERAGGLITEEEGLTSPGAIAGLYSDTPTIIGAKNATQVIPNEQFITMDVNTGEIYIGNVEVN